MSYMHLESPAQLTLRGEPIAENLSDSNSIKVYRFTWDPLVNIEKIDVKHIEFKVDEQPPTMLRNTSTEILLALSYGNHTVSIVAVDRCDRASEAKVLRLQVELTSSELPVNMIL